MEIIVFSLVFNTVYVLHVHLFSLDSRYNGWNSFGLWVSLLNLIVLCGWDDLCGVCMAKKKIKLYQKTTVEPRTGYVHSEVRRLVMEHPELRWVPQYGYNSLFPLVFRMFPLVSSIK
jgi:hypothetical protein